MIAFIERNTQHKHRQTPRVLIALAMIAVCGALLGSLHNQAKATHNIFEASLGYWEQDLAAAIENKNWLWIGKFGTTLSQNGLESILFLVDGKAVFSYPSEGVTDNQCDSPIVRSINHYGIEVSTVKACVSRSVVFQAALLSPAFLLTLLIVVGLVLLSSWVPLLGYRNSLLASIHTLEACVKSQDPLYNASPIEAPLGGLPLDLDDPLSARLLSLVGELLQTRADAEKGKALSQMAAQVSHDIRSPLAVLMGLVDENGNIHEKNKPHVRTAVHRIRDIANNLLSNHRTVHQSRVGQETKPQPTLFTSAERCSTALLPISLESAVSQKRLQFCDRPDVELEFVMHPSVASGGVFCSVQPTELDRILSNLMNNAYEAISGAGKVTVTLSLVSDTAQITVKDTGKGMPKGLLSQVGLPHQTFGKIDGNGLGISHAKTVVGSWGGALAMDSVEGQGTTITLDIPLAETPAWFASELKIKPNSLVVIADDDPSIHALWREKLANLKDAALNLKTVHLNSGKDLLSWYRQFVVSDQLEVQTDQVVYFCDYEFSDESQSGIDLLEILGASKQSVVFTSRWDEKSVLDRCQRLQMRLLPKQLAHSIVLSGVGTA